MQSTQTTARDYLEYEEHAETKHEYWEGEIRAMSGASWEHARLTFRIAERLSHHLRECTPVTSDLRVRISATRYVYPDVVVVCGKPDLTEERPPSLMNPTILVEVASESTTAVDKTDKLQAYLQIPSIKEYWIAEQDRPLVLQYVKQGDTWTLRIHGEGSVIHGPMGLELPLDEIYPGAA